MLKEIQINCMGFICPNLQAHASATAWNELHHNCLKSVFIPFAIEGTKAIKQMLMARRKQDESQSLCLLHGPRFPNVTCCCLISPSTAISSCTCPSVSEEVQTQGSFKQLSKLLPPFIGASWWKSSPHRSSDKSCAGIFPESRTPSLFLLH